ncbi:hypothetical protein KC345_g245 [Hortaea werneckii]|nr:hypothetical protein KC345_g245 [Hortaea werneckii]
MIVLQDLLLAERIAEALVRQHARRAGLVQPAVAGGHLAVCGRRVVVAGRIARRRIRRRGGGGVCPRCRWLSEIGGEVMECADGRLRPRSFLYTFSGMCG